MKMCRVSFAIALLFMVSLVNANGSRTNVTVSGASSGAAMATQLHFAFSKDISGVGVLAGPPYDCAGSLVTAAECLSGPVTKISVSDIEKRVQKYVAEGSLDSTSYMAGDPVYIFSGKFDPIVFQPIAKLNGDLYSTYNTSIKTNYDLPSTHGFPTVLYGDPCPVLNTKYFVNKCNFSLVYDVLNHLHGGNLIEPTWHSKTPLIGQTILFDQKSFLNPPEPLTRGIVDETVARWLRSNLALYDPNDWGWQQSGLSNWTIPTTTTPNDKKNFFTVGNPFYSFDTKGFIYFPLACAKHQKCPIHVGLHGCLQGKHYVGDVALRETGYLEVGEVNNIIILFPQIEPSIVSPTNPMGCWDWWGYTTKDFANKLGPQMYSVKAMIETVRLLNNAIAAYA